jgi:hypothetical protein
MPTATAVKTIVYNALVNLVKGWPAAYAQADSTKIRPGTFIYLTTPNINPLRQIAQSNDYPQLILEYQSRWHYAGDSSLNAGRGMGAFGDQFNVKPVGRPQTLTTYFNLILTHRDLNAQVDDLLEQGVIDAINSAGPTLGIPASTGIQMVQLGEIEGQTVEVHMEKPTPTMMGAKRAESTMSFPVVCRWKTFPSPTTTS